MSILRGCIADDFAGAAGLRIDHGVPSTVSLSNLLLALKSGNVDAQVVFLKALRVWPA